MIDIGSCIVSLLMNFYMVSTASDGEELKVIQKVTVLRNEKRQGGFGSFFLQYISD